MCSLQFSVFTFAEDENVRGKNVVVSRCRKIDNSERVEKSNCAHPAACKLVKMFF